MDQQLSWEEKLPTISITLDRLVKNRNFGKQNLEAEIATRALT